VTLPRGRAHGTRVVQLRAVNSATARLIVPEGALVLLVGPAGAGKSTFARRCFRPDEVLSSDAYRALVSGDEADQGATTAAFARLHAEAARRLAAGAFTVVDATNLLYADRAALCDIALHAGRPVVAIGFDVPLRQCLAWNASRPGRNVPEPVVRRHHRLLRRALAHLEREPFDQVVVLLGADAVAHTTVGRGRSGR